MRGIAIVMLSGRLSETLMICDHTDWVSSKATARIISLLLGAPTSAIRSKGNTPKFGWNTGCKVAVLSRKPAISIDFSRGTVSKLN